MERLKLAAKIKAKKSIDIEKSKIGLGFEKLDRDVFDPEKAYDYVGKLGVKWIRLQSGWQRTERQKGIYDFEWLDKVVDNIMTRDEFGMYKFTHFPIKDTPLLLEFGDFVEE